MFCFCTIKCILRFLTVYESSAPTCLCNSAPLVNSPSDEKRVLPMRGLGGWGLAAPWRKTCIHPVWCVSDKQTERAGARTHTRSDSEGSCALFSKGCIHRADKHGAFNWMQTYILKLVEVLEEIKVDNCCWWSCWGCDSTLHCCFLKWNNCLHASKGITDKLTLQLSMVLEG